jgi:hypothetical protein
VVRTMKKRKKKKKFKVSDLSKGLQLIYWHNKSANSTGAAKKRASAKFKKLDKEIDPKGHAEFYK